MRPASSGRTRRSGRRPGPARPRCASQPNRSRVCSPTGRDAEPAGSTLSVCDRPSNRMAPVDSAARVRPASSAPGSSRPAANDRTRSRSGRPTSRARPTAVASGVAGTEPPAVIGVGREQGERGQPADEAEPDREDLAVPAPGLAPELGHRHERDHRVGDQHEAEHPAAPGRRQRELHPDDDDERR